MDIQHLLSHRPRWLYEASPYLYALLGVVFFWQAMLGRAHPFALLISSGALWLAAGRVLLLRWRYRRAPRRDPNHADLTLVALTWDRSKESEHPDFNQRGRALFLAAHGLLQESSGLSRADFQTRAARLIAQVDHHFRETAAFLATHASPRTEAWRRLHQAVQQDILRGHQTLMSGQLSRRAYLQLLLSRGVLEGARHGARWVDEAIWQRDDERTVRPAQGGAPIGA